MTSRPLATPTRPGTTADKGTHSPSSQTSGTGSSAWRTSSDRDVRVRPGRGATLLAIITGLAFVVLAILVEVGATHRLDVAMREFFRPGDVWGGTQIWVDIMVEGLKPTRVLPLAVVCLLLLAVYQRSWRQAAYGLSLIMLASVAALATKVLVSRPDPHHDMSSVGSFPSGHVLVVLICLGGLLLLVVDRPHWWEWLPVAVIDAAMAISLLLQAAHWFTDVIGGALLGITALAATSGSPWRRGEPATGRDVPGPFT